MNLLKMMGEWHFDFKVIFLTIVVSPIILLVFGIIRRFLKVWVSYLADAVVYYFARFLRANLVGHLSLKRYCKLRLGEENQFLYVPSSAGAKLEVDKAYVTLMLEQLGSSATVVDHSNLLEVGTRIRVIGDPGAGKSSLVKRLMRDACRLAQATPKKARLPVLLELKKCKVPGNAPKDIGAWFLAELKKEALKNDVYRMDECFDAYVRGSGLLVLLDGLDEVASAEYQKVQAAIAGLSQTLGKLSDKNAIVLTMRTQFHMQVKDAFRDSFGHVVALRPFTPSNIYEFLKRWDFGANQREQVNRVYKQLTDRPSLREMCSNPLVLSMYVASDQEKRNLVAPESRTEFYKKVTEELMIKRRLAQTGAVAASFTLREQRERILGRIAYEHMLNADEPNNLLEWDAAIKIVQAVMACDEAKAAEVLREIAKETGLISEERIGETFRFIHLTFCEFLAAFEAVNGQEAGWARLRDTHLAWQAGDKPFASSRLLETIPFACGLLPRVARSGAITDLVGMGDRGLLARAFLETKLYEHGHWPAFATEWKDELLRAAESEWNDAWLRNLHLFNVVVADANQCMAHMTGLVQSANFDELFQGLVAKQKDSLGTLLSAYATQDAAAAFRLAENNHLDLARDFPEIVIKHCDQEPFFELILEHALAEPERANVWAPLFAEAGLRSAVVARNMSDREMAEEWQNWLIDVPKSKTWYRKGLVARHFYSQCLTIAMRTDAVTPYIAKRLNLQRWRLPPGAYRNRDLWISSVLLLALIFLVTCEGLLGLLPALVNGRVLAITVLFFWVFMYFSFAVFYGKIIKLRYLWILFGREEIFKKNRRNFHLEVVDDMLQIEEGDLSPRVYLLRSAVMVCLAKLGGGVGGI